MAAENTRVAIGHKRDYGKVLSMVVKSVLVSTIVTGEDGRTTFSRRGYFCSDGTQCVLIVIAGKYRKLIARSSSI